MGRRRDERRGERDERNMRRKQQEGRRKKEEEVAVVLEAAESCCRADSWEEAVALKAAVLPEGRRKKEEEKAVLLKAACKKGGNMNNCCTSAFSLQSANFAFNPPCSGEAEDTMCAPSLSWLCGERSPRV